MQINRRKLGKMTFIPTMVININYACRSRGNLQDRTVAHEILEMSTQHSILLPVIGSLYKYLHLPIACNIAPCDAIVYISSAYCNYIPRRHYRAALTSTLVVT
jgi:hypothetical protein